MSYVYFPPFDLLPSCRLPVFAAAALVIEPRMASWRPPVERELRSSSSHHRERDVASVSRIPKPSPKPSPKQTPPLKLRSTAAALRSELAHVSDQLTAAQQKLSGLEQQRLEAETPPHLRCPITLQRMCSPVRGLSQTLEPHCLRTK